MPTTYIRIKRLLFGRPLASDRLEHERLNKQTLIVLAILGTAALSYVVPISAVIVGLVVLVALSYRETIFAYPQGGGSYTVAKDNLGTTAGLVAAASLLTDYILTVSVSISSGVAAITSAYPALIPHTVTLGIVSVFVLMAVNLRGVRESGIAFSVPTYVFIGMMLTLILVGLYRAILGHEPAPPAGPLRVDVVSSALNRAATPPARRWCFLSFGRSRKDVSRLPERRRSPTG